MTRFQIHYKRVVMEFTEFDLHEELQKGIAGAGYVTCTPVQEQVLKGSLEGADLYVQSQTGTGKTAAYLISIIQEMLTREEVAGKKALVMVPTRELAVQVEQEAKKLLEFTPLKAGSFYGGVGYTQQTAMLKNNVNIIIGTPGRVIDLQESGAMDLSSVAFLVVDEADRMFDMGFYPDLRTLIKVLPKTHDRQTMLFSATLNTYVKNLAWEYTEEAKEITIEAEQLTVEEIDQVLLHVSSDSKMKLLLGILQHEKPESVIVFCNTKRSCEVVAKRLQLNGIESEFIIGDLPQAKRLQVLESFKRGSLKCLVATDVAARGIDVNDLAMVVNYDLPNESENYVHRIGRTARAGKSGKAYTFCSEQDVYNLPAIERYLGAPIPASVAYEDMMTEDKSASVYIRTGDYGDDDGRPFRNRRDGGDRRGASRSGDSRRPPRDGAAADSRNNRNRRGPDEARFDGDRKPRTDIRTERGGRNDRTERAPRGKPGQERAAGSYRKNAPVRAENRYQDRREETENLAALPFDERMKRYKEKYADTASASAGSRDKNAAKRRATAAGGKNGGKRYEKNTPRGERKEFRRGADGYAGNTENRYQNRRTQSAPETVQKKNGLLGRIKSLFSKKKKD